MKSIITEYYKPKLDAEMFIPCTAPDTLPKAGECWKMNDALGSGYYWVYDSGKGYNIKIHAFRFHEDFLMNMAIPECLSVTYYTSIAGEELDPYRQLRCNVVKSFLGGYKPFRAVIHKKIPIEAIGIEYEPAYYETYLKEHYGQLYQSPQDAFRSIDETTSFPEMTLLLTQAGRYTGTGVPAELFFDAKAAEALSLVFERHQRLNSHTAKKLSDEDCVMMESLAAYISNHYADSLNNDLLAKIACMGTTKLKSCFRAHFGCTITDYIQTVRIGQAEHLLSFTELPVVQVAQAVGYTNAGRFAELFRRAKGVLPMEYRRLSQKE